MSIILNKKFKLIFSAITGSHLYGTALPDSDEDIRGVFIPTEEFYLGFLNKVEQVESKKPDMVYWEISKFFKLCLDSNPNIVELLFIPEEYIINSSSQWSTILDNKNLFLSTKAKHTFSGYAVSQLHRIKQHREWLLNPPKTKPSRGDFGLPESNVVTKDQINAYDELVSMGTPLKLTDNVLEALHKEKAYINAMRRWNNYKEWEKNRNQSRALLEKQFGYDTKHASHLVRLLDEGKELITSGKITFPRPNSEELLSIRNGAYNYDELMDRVGGSDGTEIDNFLSVDSVLPHSPNRKKADELCITLIKERINRFPESGEEQFIDQSLHEFYKKKGYTQ